MSNSSHSSQDEGRDARCLYQLLAAKLFQKCPHHFYHKDTDAKYLCLKCSPLTNRGYCRLCIQQHATCQAGTIKCRRYMYQDVIAVKDLEAVIEPCGIQTYSINGHTVALIQPKPKTTMSPFHTYCAGCQTPMNSEWTWCSIKCKLCDVHWSGSPTEVEGVMLSKSLILHRRKPAHPRRSCFI